MKCLKCGAWSGVLETRKEDDGYTVKRRHKCANDHTFWTYQIYKESYTWHVRMVHERRVRIGRREWQPTHLSEVRVLRMLASGLSQRKTAAQLGITQAYVWSLAHRRKKKSVDKVSTLIPKEN